MSKFKNSRVYIIVNESDIDTDMLNYSTSKSLSSVPTKTSGGVVKKLLEFVEPAPDMVSTYTWYDQDEVVVVWEALP